MYDIHQTTDHRPALIRTDIPDSLDGGKTLLNFIIIILIIDSQEGWSIGTSLRCDLLEVHM